MKTTRKLGFGCMRLPKDCDSSIEIDAVSSMFDTFLKYGFSYFDTAYIYEGSENTLRCALVNRYSRDRFQLASKLPLYLVNKDSPMISFFETTLYRLGTNYLDVYLLHGLDDFWCDKAEDIDAWGFLNSLKVSGNAKSIGFSFHGSPEKLNDVLSAHPEIDFVQLQINYVDWFDPKIKSKQLYETARKHNVPIIVMEPAKGGLLSNDKLPAFQSLKNVHPAWSLSSWAMKFVNSLEGVSIVLSGMNRESQLLDNINVFSNGLTLAESERSLLFETALLLRNMPRIDCTSCGYCMNVCPRGIKIPILIDLLNDYQVYKSFSNFLHMYNMFTEDGTKASLCINCKQCEKRCPQKLNISDIIHTIRTIVD